MKAKQKHRKPPNKQTRGYFCLDWGGRGVYIERLSLSLAWLSVRRTCREPHNHNPQLHTPLPQSSWSCVSPASPRRSYPSLSSSRCRKSRRESALSACQPSLSPFYHIPAQCYSTRLKRHHVRRTYKIINTKVTCGPGDDTSRVNFPAGTRLTGQLQSPFHPPTVLTSYATAATAGRRGN